MPDATLSARAVVPRYAVAAVVAVVVLAVSATAVVMAWQRWPDVALTVTVLVAADLAGAVVGLRVGARQRASLRVLVQDAERRADAYRLGDSRTDLAEAGKATAAVEAARYRDALEHIALPTIDAGGECETFTGPSTCRDANSGRRRDGVYGAERWCDTCIALDALEDATDAEQLRSGETPVVDHADGLDIEPWVNTGELPHSHLSEEEWRGFADFLDIDTEVGE